MTDLLLLGGTGWLGPEVATEALSRGIAVSTLTRGQRGDAPDGVQPLIGDRTAPGGYDAVLGRSWDLVLDTTWQPGMARSAVAALGARAGWWGQVSSTGVYADSSATAEDDPTVTALDSDHATNETYTRAKVACENAVVDALGERSLVARAGLLCGPGDISDRFGYWAARSALAADGPVLVPDIPDQPVQVLDVRDLAAWLVDSMTTARTGLVNAVGPTWRFAEVLDAARTAAGAVGPTVMVSPESLDARDVQPWIGPRSMPLWYPDGFAAGGPLVSDDARIRESGVRYRSLPELTLDCLGFERAQGLSRDRKAGLTRDEELSLIQEAQS